MIILLNGSINSGKTTTARRLMALLPRAAHVEVDALREFVACLPLAEAIPISLENAAAVTRNLARRGFDVVLSYPLGAEDHAGLVAAFADLATPLHTFTLSLTLATALADRGERRLSEDERRRIREQYAADGHRPAFGVRIDTTAQTPDETAAIILDHVDHVDHLGHVGHVRAAREAVGGTPVARDGHATDAE